MTGKLITFEGIDACGKSTQIRLINEYLENKGIETIITREPGGTSIAEKIRTLLLDPESDLVDRTELLLFSAARAQNVAELLLPNLKKGKTILSDRFYDATTAYQAGGRGIELKYVEMLNEFATMGIKPDRTYLFDITIEESRKRLERAGHPKDRMEKETVDFFNRVRQEYLNIAKREPERVKVFDGNQYMEDVHTQLVYDVKSMLNI